MPSQSPPWLEPKPPWLAPVPPALCAGLAIAPDDVPVVEVLGAPCSLAEVVAVRAGRYVPLYGNGARREEALRALALVTRVLGADADPRGPEHALAMTLHPAIGTRPLRALAQSASDGDSPVWFCEMALAYVGVLGATDALREQVARELTSAKPLALELSVALGAGGGDYGTFREHYLSLTASPHSDTPTLRALRAWFDFVLARRFGGLDALRALGENPQLDPASRWLVLTGEFLAGEESARARMTESAEALLSPVHHLAPRLSSTVAREMAEIVQHPLGMRMAHLKCAAARDHAAVAIRAWLAAATEPESEDEVPGPALSPEPSRAGKAAIEARAAAGEFLLDWFVPEREARERVDGFARRVLRIYHRLRGAQMLARVERELRPAGSALSSMERMVWSQGAVAER